MKKLTLLRILSSMKALSAKLTTLIITQIIKTKSSCKMARTKRRKMVTGRMKLRTTTWDLTTTFSLKMHMLSSLMRVWIRREEQLLIVNWYLILISRIQIDKKEVRGRMTNRVWPQTWKNKLCLQMMRRMNSMVALPRASLKGNQGIYPSSSQEVLTLIRKYPDCIRFQ